MFNEALNKAMEEKNRQVQELQDQLAVVTTNSEKTNGCQRLVIFMLSKLDLLFSFFKVLRFLTEDTLL